MIIRAGAVPKDIIVPTNAEHSVIRGKVTRNMRVELGQVVGEERGKRNTGGAQLAVRPMVIELGLSIPKRNGIQGARLRRFVWMSRSYESNPNASVGAPGKSHLGS